MRTLLLTAAALSAPHAAKVRGNQGWGGSTTPLSSIASGPLPSVPIKIDSFVPIDVRHAYDDIIAEAGEKYHLDPLMIRSVML